MIDEMLNVAMLAAKWAGLPFEDFQADMRDKEKGRRLSRLASHVCSFGEPGKQNGRNFNSR